MKMQLKPVFYNLIGYNSVTLLKTEKMEINWIIIAVVLVCAIALILYLIKKNQKDKKDVTKFFNSDTTIRKESELDEEEEY